MSKLRVERGVSAPLTSLDYGAHFWGSFSDCGASRWRIGQWQGREREREIRRLMHHIYSWKFSLDKNSPSPVYISTALQTILYSNIANERWWWNLVKIFSWRKFLTIRYNTEIYMHVGKRLPRKNGGLEWWSNLCHRLDWWVMASLIHQNYLPRTNDFRNHDWSYYTSSSSTPS